jgi:hypothetical protein
MEHDIIYKSTTLKRLYYDASGVSPHSETTRATYTPSTNTYGALNSVFIFVQRVTAAGTVGKVVAKVQLLCNGSEIINIGMGYLKDNNVDAYSLVQLPCDILIRPTDILRITTYDGSTGGTVNYSIYCSIVEHY